MKYTIRQLCLYLLLSFTLPAYAQEVPPLDPRAAGMSAERLERLSSYLEQEIEGKRLPGAVALVVRKGFTALHQTYGYQNRETQKPMQKDQLFYIQSMTKPIISVGIMMLYEQGYFDLDDPVSDYLPQFADRQVEVSDEEKGTYLVPAESQITIANLLSHTAGFSHGLGNSELDKRYREALYMQNHSDVEARVNALAEMPLVGQPGKQWYYSASPDVLALLIEHFSGMNTADYLQQHIFDPLDMDDTGYNLRKDNRDRAVALHYKAQDGTLGLSPNQTPASGHTIYGGTHGLFSSADDYLRFCRMLLNGGELDGERILSPKTVELMTVNHVGDLFGDEGYGFGLGFSVRTDLAAAEELGTVGTFGWSGAYNTYFFVDPEEELIGILMTQFAPYTNFYKEKFQQLVYQSIVE
ncbi:MAG: serine hydrolase domain-containing protein [Cyclobacteriaceae bacterium]